MKIDHIGYAVRRVDRAIRAFEQMGFAFEPPLEDPERNVRLSFGEKDGYRVELVSPLDKSRPSPVDAYLAGNVGTPYHFCYESGDLEADMAALQVQGCKVVIPPAPAAAFGGRRVVFLMNIGFGLMEVVEAEERDHGV